MFKRPTELFQMKPVQLGLKALAAGSLFAASIYAYSSIKKKVLGPEDTTLLLLKKNDFSSEAIRNLDFIWANDTTWIELLGRLAIFRNFAKNTFDDIISGIRSAMETNVNEYSALSSYRIRSNYQKVIELIRLFRAILDKKIPVEDFDEIAVEINAYVEQLCSDAIQNTYM
jgi:hypothetical protein